MNNLSEDEKQAIEYFKRNLEMTKEMGKKWGFQEEIKNNEIILNLIEKQEKEIEELKDITRTYDSMKGIMPEGCSIVIADKEYFDSGRFIEKYISKDKIREDIKKFEKLQEQTEPVLQDIKYTRKDLIRYLKELLEGE